MKKQQNVEDTIDWRYHRQMLKTNLNWGHNRKLKAQQTKKLQTNTKDI